jgi:hypothetical protein
MRKEALQKELDEESDIHLIDEEGAEATDTNPRKSSLSPLPPPSQFLQSKATKPLNRSATKQPEAMGNSLVFATPAQDSEGNRKEASADVPIEAVTSMIVSGAISVQRDSQGLLLGSSSRSIPPPCVQPTTYRMCASASTQSCSRAVSAWIWKISPYYPRETLAGARHGHPL